MKGDFTRNRFSPERHYTGVRLQQGRVQLDADWNEQIDIAAERVRAGTRDIVGPAGGPLPNPGFEIVADPALLPAAVTADLTARGLLPLAPGNIVILPGRYYVDGVPVDNPSATTLVAQPDGEGTALPEGRHLLYVDAWEQHLTFVDDAAIREVALGGPDTTTRTRQVWQVRSQPVNETFHCLASDTDWDALVAGSTGRMAARAEVAVTPVDPCVVPATAGYRGLQNRLYRVEIHLGGTLANATFKWSRDNGTVLFAIEETNVGGAATRVRLRSLGRDESLSLKIGDWVEVLDDDNEPAGAFGLLTQVADVDENDLIVTLANAVASIDPARHAKLRRWDSAGAIRIGPKHWVALEEGIEVQFEAGTYRTGDYWLIPARTILGNPLLVDTNGLDWPTESGNPVARTPEGIVHRYARLAIVRRTATATTREHDCRPLFPTLTDLKHLHYESGDGQEAMPDLTLPPGPPSFVALAEPLRVGVSNGRWPVAGARVRFTLGKDLPGELVAPPGARVDPASPQNAEQRTFLTGADGIASCEWHLVQDRKTPVQQAIATLLDAGGAAVHLPVIFTANLSMAERVAYDPGDCVSLGSARSVQRALELLASLVQLHYVGGDGQEVAPGAVMPMALQVRVASPCGPVASAHVRFETPNGGQLAATLAELTGTGGSNPFVATTDTSGLAVAFWMPAPGAPGPQSVQAVLQPNSLRLGAFTNVTFNGRVVPPVPADPGITVRRIRIGSPLKDLMLDSVVTPQILLAGIEIDTSGLVDPDLLQVDGPQPAILSVSLCLPYPLTPTDEFFWPGNDTHQPIYGFTTLELAASIEVKERTIRWIPARSLRGWIGGLLFPALKRARRDVDRLLVRLTLRGNFVLAMRVDPEVYLDADLYRIRKDPGYDLPSGDRRKGGTLDLWFWLQEGTAPPPPTP